MDEVERMFASPFRSDFFSMLRSWHNNRARGGDWTRFNMALVTSTEPYQFIADLNQSWGSSESCTSCGKCVPCRIGLTVMLRKLEDIVAGKGEGSGTEEDRMFRGQVKKQNKTLTTTSLFEPFQSSWSLQRPWATIGRSLLDPASHIEYQFSLFSYPIYPCSR
jgi:hypothetical protein